MKGNKAFEEQHSLNDMLRTARERRQGLNMPAPKLSDVHFPNGRMWWVGGTRYPHSYRLKCPDHVSKWAYLASRAGLRLFSVANRTDQQPRRAIATLQPHVKLEGLLSDIVR